MNVSKVLGNFFGTPEALNLVEQNYTNKSHSLSSSDLYTYNELQNN
jgi:hypothetical protein